MRIEALGKRAWAGAFAVACLAGASAVLADEGATDTATMPVKQIVLTTEPRLVSAPVVETREITGSNIKCTFKRNDRITTSPFNVTVLDCKRIKRSGAVTLEGILRAHGLNK
jgi:hypothetical protein